MAAGPWTRSSRRTGLSAVPVAVGASRCSRSITRTLCFCRALHTECVEHLIGAPQYAAIRLIVYNSLVHGRKLNWGNANAGNIGSDYAQLGLDIWSSVHAASPRSEQRQKKLEQLNLWRNEVAHHDFDKPRLGGRRECTLSEVREWRRACNALALDFDRAARAYLIGVTGQAPW
jgi:hypothetical protein